MIWLPSIEYVIALHEKVIRKTILMNRNGLEATLDKVYFGIPFHEQTTIFERVTILFKEIVENHYFMDGNKRIGILLAVIFLEKNEIMFNPPSRDIFFVTMAVARGEKTFNEIKEWFKLFSKKK
ncbi:MAG: type II toxin-antitoxin system death-on-curing family toxin [Promethearchaeota archaeon]